MHLKSERKSMQLGLSLIESVFVFFLSIPCIILIQNEIVSSFWSVTKQNILVLFSDVSKHVAYNVSSTPEDITDVFKKINIYKLQSSAALFKNDYNEQLMSFYARYSENKNGVYILGILDNEGFSGKYSLSDIYDVLGGGGGIVRDGKLISIDKSFSDIDITNIDLPKNALAYFLYEPISTNKNNEYLNALYYNGDYINDGVLKISSCDKVCENSSLIFIFNNVGFTDVDFFALVDGRSLLQFGKIDVKSGVFFLRVETFIDELKKNNLLRASTISFYMTGVSSATGKKQTSYFKPSVNILP